LVLGWIFFSFLPGVWFVFPLFFFGVFKGVLLVFGLGGDVFMGQDAGEFVGVRWFDFGSTLGVWLNI
jgi:hypothetical protein